MKLDGIVNGLALICVCNSGISIATAQTNEPRWDVAIGNPGLGGTVASLVVHDDGTSQALYAGGAFTTAGGEPAARVARWDGTTWSPLGTGIRGTQDEFDADVFAMISFDDGHGQGLFVGGDFDRAGEVQEANSIAVWRNGEWSPVGGGVRSSFGGKGTIRSFGVFDDGAGPALYMGGLFDMAGGRPASCIAKWNGLVWTKLGNGLSFTANSMAEFDDGRGRALFVAGAFADPRGGFIDVAVAKWNGNAWEGMPTRGPRGDWYNYNPCPIGHFCPVYDPPRGDVLTVFDAGRGDVLILAGAFKIGLDDFQSPIQWNGRRWSAVQGGSVDGRILSLAVHDDGGDEAVYAGGSFSAVGRVECRQIARWNGRFWTELGQGAQPGPVHALASFDDGSGPALYVAGDIESVGGQSTQNIARWDSASKLFRAKGLR